MTAKKFEFTHTNNAIEELSTALFSLDKVLKDKKLQTDKQNKKMETLRLSTKEVIGGIDNILKKLNKATD